MVELDTLTLVIHLVTVDRSATNVNASSRMRIADRAGCMLPDVQIQLDAIVLNCDDIDATASFWARFLGGRVEPVADPYVTALKVLVDDMPSLTLQKVRSIDTNADQPPMCLDFAVDDIEDAHRRVIDAGATVDRPRSGPQFDSLSGFQSYNDPSRHLFILSWG